MITDYDIRVLVALNQIENSDEIKTRDLTSWVVMKNLSSQGKTRENNHVLFSLKKLNQLSLVNLEKETDGHETKNVWTINNLNVKFKRFRFLDGRKNCILCKIDGDWLVRSLKFTEKKL